MAFFEWDERYSVGVASLDAQHKVLIKLIDRLDEIEARGGDLEGVMDRLDWYVHHHFSFEEALMKGAGYPAFDAHVAEHRAFGEWLRSNRLALRAGRAEARDLAGTVNDYLKDWLRNHILVVDMDYKTVLTAAAGGSLAVLAETLVETLEQAQAKPTPEAVAEALSLARDIKLCAEGADER